MPDGHDAGPRSILVDGYNLAMSQGTGIATYARGLCRSIRAIGDQAHVLYGQARPQADGSWPPAPTGKASRTLQRFRLAPSSLLAARPTGLTSAAILGEASPLPDHDSLWWSPGLFDRASVRFSVTRGFLPVRVPQPMALAHWTCPLPLRLKGARNIYTLHDLVPLRLPEGYQGVKRFAALAARIARTADHIVTVSECSRRDIIDLLGVPEDRVTNTYQAVPLANAAAGAPDQRRRVIEALGLTEGGYFLFIGTIEPKKNLHRLIQAYLASGVAAPLLVIGKLGWMYDQELALMTRLNCQNLSDGPAAGELTGRVLRMNFCPRADLDALTAGARAVLFPSLYEGFGLPVLEAMQSGAPVMTSNTGSLPEVAGDAALQIDPYDVAAMAAAIRTLDVNEALRQELSAKGRRQAGRFSAEAHDQRLADLYRHVLSTPMVRA